MSDITSERIEPTPRVIEPQGPNPRGQADSGPGAGDLRSSEEPAGGRKPGNAVHQVDRLV